MCAAIVFALRFGNEDGFVQQFFAKQRDLVARELHDAARCILAFKQLGSNPVYSPRWAEEAQLDFYNFTTENKQNMSEFIRNNDVILIIFQGANISGEIDLGFFRKLNVRTINTEDSSFDQNLTQSFAKIAVKFLLRSVLTRGVHDLHITNTRGQFDFFRNYTRIPPQRLRTVPYGIDTNYFCPGSRDVACSQLGLDSGTIWVMAAAQSRPEKRVDLLLKAMRRVKEARPNIRIGFFYVGDGWMLAQWKELAQSFPALDNSYQFFGKQSDLRIFYRAASIFIHGAYKESFGLVLAEAMASGLPIVATRAHGPLEIVQDGTTGYLVEQDDWDGFVNAVLSYIDQPQLREEHGVMGRKRCLERYSCDREARELADLIRPFLRRRNLG